MIKDLLPVLAALALTGCVDGLTRVESTVTSFHRLTAVPTSGKKLVILAYPAERQQTLEFASYRSKLAAKFAEKGMIVVDSAAKADWVAFVSYGIDGGTERSGIVSIPEFGQTGGRTTFHSGTVSGSGGTYGTYSGTSYTMPTFGVTGYSTQTVTSTRFRRNLAIDIIDRVSLEDGHPMKLYEGRLVSRGSCGSSPASLMH